MLGLAGIVAALIAGATFWGWTRGGDAMLEALLNNPDRSSTIWQRELLLQRHFLNSLQRDMGADLSALAVSVGRMQGRMTRLEVAAEHVVTAAGLDATEYAFERPPPVGGPEPEHSDPPQWQGLLENIDALGDELELREARLSMLEAFLLNREQMDDTRPAGTPVADGWISSGYGYRTDPVNGRREFHSGIDFVGKPGVEVRAAAPGLVIWSGKRWGYGNLVEINHGNGYVTRYAHNRVNLVSVGEKVDKNQPIALLGATGRVTGPHVHFEVVRDDKTVNPSRFIGRHARN
ncbi:MAG: M23 family metallopeptidase [Gammaproteobacteria bacterium]|nr:M23 family metallopeptidase [Gammaproteobacteria bacterium]